MIFTKFFLGILGQFDEQGDGKKMQKNIKDDKNLSDGFECKQFDSK